MTEHTKGPWRQRSDESVAVVDANGSAIAYTDTFLAKEECIANARLISAAPELLEALKLIRVDHSIMEPHHEDMCSLCKQVDAAIAKGEGRQ